jgi:hypothetical protein
MLGLIIGFLISETTDLSVIVNVCLGAAIALGMSGISSAYVSESAERKRALLKLEEAMIEDLHDSAHGEAAREVPILIALVNGCAPLIMSLLILTPLFLANAGFPAIPGGYRGVTTYFSAWRVSGPDIRRLLVTQRDTYPAGRACYRYVHLSTDRVLKLTDPAPRARLRYHRVIRGWPRPLTVR